MQDVMLKRYNASNPPEPVNRLEEFEEVGVIQPHAANFEIQRKIKNAN
jgi:hypothetical protein